jgi:hypothetical protein
VQRSRGRGAIFPPNTIYVGRPGRFGNPFTIAKYREAFGSRIPDATASAECVVMFRLWLNGCDRWWQGPESDQARRAITSNVHRLRGKNLGCWCPLDQPCHADVLLEMANQTESQSENNR